MNISRIKTQEVQNELAKNELKRLEKLKFELIKEEEKELKLKLSIELRKKEINLRNEKLKFEENKKLNLIPKTRNLYELKQERIKRGLNLDGTEDFKFNSTNLILNNNNKEVSFVYFFFTI